MKRMLVVFVLFGVIQISAQWYDQTSPLTTALYSVYAFDNNYAYACGEAGKVISTSNGGANWNVVSNATIPSTLPLYWVGAADSVTFGVLGADASGTYAYFTADGGSNWSLILSQTGGFFNFAGFIDTTSPRPILIQGDPVGGRWSLFKSSNFIIWDSTGLYLPQVGGEAGWNNSFANYSDILAFWFGTNAGHIYYSSDGGASWESQDTPGMTNSYAISFNGGGNGLAGGDGLCKTTDYGTTWTQITSPSAGGIFGIGGAGYQSSANFWAAGPTALYSTTDFGTTWNNDHPSPGGNYTHLFSRFVSVDVSVFAVTDDGSISKLDYIIPVELTSFTANVNNDGNVVLNWSTATEINNQMFEIERRLEEDQFVTIGYVNGNGTTSEPQEYSYIDNTVGTGTYYYRLKQIDFGGQYEYSDEIEVEVNGPLSFDLEQNYPNPFNPSTKIDFSLAVDSKVSLKVFDVLGQEVANLVNTNLVAGSHNVDFNAASINSGVYFYRIEATGIDGTNFTNVKKMILAK